MILADNEDCHYRRVQISADDGKLTIGTFAGSGREDEPDSILTFDAGNARELLNDITRVLAELEQDEYALTSDGMRDREARTDPTKGSER